MNPLIEISADADGFVVKMTYGSKEITALGRDLADALLTLAEHLEYNFEGFPLIYLEEITGIQLD
jgi:hypothetical protein